MSGTGSTGYVAHPICVHAGRNLVGIPNVDEALLRPNSGLGRDDSKWHENQRKHRDGRREQDQQDDDEENSTQREDTPLLGWSIRGSATARMPRC